MEGGREGGMEGGMEGGRDGWTGQLGREEFRKSTFHGFLYMGT